MAGRPKLLIGCAGWSIPGMHASGFPTEGSHLARYGATLPAVEINSSFYRPHQMQTYARWHATVPDDFRFSVKVPKQITHILKLVAAEAEIDRFIAGTAALSEKLGCFLVQLPPSLAFDEAIVDHFLEYLTGATDTTIVLEPRHISWTGPAATRLLARHGTGLVFADPNPLRTSAPTVTGNTVYVRLHGSPVIYRSSYSDAYLDNLARQLEKFLAQGVTTWCIFDNTANGAATRNALDLMLRLAGKDALP